MIPPRRACWSSSLGSRSSRRSLSASSSAGASDWRSCSLIVLLSAYVSGGVTPPRRASASSSLGSRSSRRSLSASSSAGASGWCSCSLTRASFQLQTMSRPLFFHNSEPELLPDEVVVDPLPLHQLLVRALLDEPASLEDDDQVGVADRREPVGDHERRAALEDLVHVGLHGPLRPRVERARRL